LCEGFDHSKTSRRWTVVVLLRASNLTTTERRTPMNYLPVIVILVAILLGTILGSAIVSVLNDGFRRAFPVPEGFVGLLYHKGKSVALLPAGRRVRWGWHYSLNVQDVRKTSLLVAGQDVLTADSVSLKLSLLVSYQVADPVKATHETQNW